MNINTILHNLRDAVHDNAATQTWCTANYSQNQKVYVGVDVRNPPASTDYPLVHIFPVEKVEGYEFTVQDHGIGVTCGIHDANMLTTGKARAVEYRGVSYLESFRKLVEAAVVAANIGTLRIDALTIEYETVEFFPYFLATMEFKMIHDYSQGDDVFA